MDRYLYLQRLFNHYWKRWKQEHLHHLTVRNKWLKEQPLLQEGDIVLVSEDNVPRGRDGLVQMEKTVLHRPMQRLHRLEIESATPQKIAEDITMHGGEKLETNCVNYSKSVPVTKPKHNVVLSNRGQGGENVTACYTSTGRLSKKLNSTLWVPRDSICSIM